MFYILPVPFNLAVALLPIIAFRVLDFWRFKKSPDYERIREKYRSYWWYQTRGPKNPKITLYAAQLAWALLMLIPIGG
jgi:hypothetical protein